MLDRGKAGELVLLKNSEYYNTVTDTEIKRQGGFFCKNKAET